MRQLIANEKIVVETMKCPIYLPDSSVFHQKAYSDLNHFLIARHLPYSEQSAMLWISEIKMAALDLKYMVRYERAIVCLDDVFRKGSVQAQHLEHEKLQLSDMHSRILDEYLLESSSEFTKRSQASNKWSVTCFLRFIQGTGHESVESIRFSDLFSFIQTAKVNFEAVLSTKCFIQHFLEFLQKRCIINERIWFYIEYFSLIREWNEYTSDERKGFEPFRTHTQEGELERLFAHMRKAIDILNDEGHQSALICTARRTFKLLYVFVGMNNLHYDPVLAGKWLDASKDVLKGAWSMARKGIETLASTFGDEFCQTPGTEPEPSGWSDGAVSEFIAQKEKEKWAESTVANYSACARRLTAYLDAKGIRSYADITPETIHTFNREDIHETTAGKNACNSRIRKFLIFLEAHGYTSVVGLSHALMPGSVLEEKLVVILNDNEIEKIKAYVQKAATPAELRNAAIVLLGLGMGIRACDIVCLELGDIDWARRIISFTQKKTKKRIELAMPAAVGNAIFEYLKKGRPRAIACTKVFVSTRRKYSALSPSAPRGILKKILPERNVRRSGFHVLRKTFVSAHITAGTLPELTAELIGHSGLGNIHKYISLDTGGMCQCPLSFKDAGITEVDYAEDY